MTLGVGTGGYVLGAGEGEALWFADGLLTYKTTGDQSGGGLTVAEVAAPKGSGSPLHLHRHEDEAWYILDGRLTFWLDGDQRTASTGDFVFGPRMVEHRFRVDSTEARFLLLLTPAGFEEFTRTCGRPATDRRIPPPGAAPADVEVFLAAAETYGLDIRPTP